MFCKTTRSISNEAVLVGAVVQQSLIVLAAFLAARNGVKTEVHCMSSVDRSTVYWALQSLFRIQTDCTCVLLKKKRLTGLNRLILLSRPRKLYNAAALTSGIYIRCKPQPNSLLAGQIERMSRCLRAAAALGTCGAVAALSPTAKSVQRMGESSRRVSFAGGLVASEGRLRLRALLTRLLRAVEPWRALGPPSNYGCPMLPSTMHLEDKAYFNLGRVWTTSVAAIFARGWSAHDGLKTILDCLSSTAALR